MYPFRATSLTARMAVTAASAVMPLPGGPVAGPTQVRLRVKAGSAAAVHVHFAKAAEVNPTALVPTAGGVTNGHRGIDPGGVEIFTIPEGVDRIVAIGDGGTATLDVTVGEGD